MVHINEMTVNKIERDGNVMKATITFCFSIKGKNFIHKMKNQTR